MIMSSTDTSPRIFIAVAGLLFAASTTLTIAWCRAMSAMHGMPMPGGWHLSMMWMPMSGQGWFATATTFLGMWLVMMVAMMLPTLLPVLWRYRRDAAFVTSSQCAVSTLLIGSAYFLVWTLFGAVAFVVGAALAQVTMQSPSLARAVPGAVGATVLIAGALQFSRWKMRRLSCCRQMEFCCACRCGDAISAWRYGLRLGVQCVHCCLGLTAMLLAVGAMNLYAMALVTAAISAERIAPRGERAARLIGIVLIGSGLVLMARSAVA